MARGLSAGLDDSFQIMGRQMLAAQPRDPAQALRHQQLVPMQTLLALPLVGERCEPVQLLSGRHAWQRRDRCSQLCPFHLPEVAGQRIGGPTADRLLEVQIALCVALCDAGVLELDQMLRFEAAQPLQDVVGGAELAEGDRQQMVHLGLVERHPGVDRRAPVAGGPPV